MKLNYVLIPLVVAILAGLGGWITAINTDWYSTLNLPSFTPADNIFGWAWGIIFFLSAISVLVVWNRTSHDHRFRLTMGVFVLNALLNLFWTILFFGAHWIGAAVFDAGALGLSVYALIILIAEGSITASALLIPYASWVTFATFLTYSVWFINR